MYQKLGWILAIAAPLFFTIAVCIYNEREHHLLPSYNYTTISYLLLFSGMFLIAFSKEKVEDEMIRELRFSSISIAAGIQFCLFIINSLIFAFDHSIRFIESPIFYILYDSLSSIAVLFFLYILIFRIKLYLNR